MWDREAAAATVVHLATHPRQRPDYPFAGDAPPAFPFQEPSALPEDDGTAYALWAAVSHDPDYLDDAQLRYLLSDRRAFARFALLVHDIMPDWWLDELAEAGREYARAWEESQRARRAEPSRAAGARSDPAGGRLDWSPPR